MSLTDKAQRAFSIDDLRALSKRRLPRAIFEFFDGGAEEEITLRDNIAAFRRIRLAPKALNDVSAVDTSLDLVGARASFPLAIAPTGALNFGRHASDIAIAKAAAAMGIPYTLSTSATTTIEAIASAAPGRLWFQAYILADKQKLAALIERARVAQSLPFSKRGNRLWFSRSDRPWSRSPTIFTASLQRRQPHSAVVRSY